MKQSIESRLHFVTKNLVFFIISVQVLSVVFLKHRTQKTFFGSCQNWRRKKKQWKKYKEHMIGQVWSFLASAWCKRLLKRDQTEKLKNNKPSPNLNSNFYKLHRWKWQVTQREKTEEFSYRYVYFKFQKKKK